MASSTIFLTGVFLISVLVFSTQSEETCPALSSWSQCTAGCRRTCRNPNPKICFLVCLSGCVCHRPYVYDENKRLCVPPDQCSYSRKRKTKLAGIFQ
uniref:U22-Liphistoxin-Lsp1a_2 n=1 Tax=Liphistius sp. SGP-2016 TaxID=1905180 RepID=A0A4Q8K5G2_9ARAC